MDREELEGYLAAGMSLEKIGAAIGRDPSTVGYWIKRHGLKAAHQERHAARGGIAHADLEELVDDGFTLQAMATQLDRSIGTVRYWLTRYELRVDRRRGRRPVVPREVVKRAIAEGRRTVEAVCGKHGRTTFVIENSGRTRCRQCRMERVSAWRRRVKRRLVQEAGGRCSRCGYDRFAGALHFHHLDPATKEFELSHKGRARSIKALRAEAAKCVVLCATCHAEVEAGIPD